MIRLGPCSHTDSTVFTTGHGLVTWRGFINVLREGIKRNLCPTVNEETLILTVEDQKGRTGIFFCLSNGLAMMGNNACKGQISPEKSVAFVEF